MKNHKNFKRIGFILKFNMSHHLCDYLFSVGRHAWRLLSPSSSPHVSSFLLGFTSLGGLARLSAS